MNLQSSLVRKPKQIDELTVAWRAAERPTLPSAAARAHTTVGCSECWARPWLIVGSAGRCCRCAFPFPPDATQAHELRPKLCGGSILDPLPLEATKAKCAEPLG